MTNHPHFTQLLDGLTTGGDQSFALIARADGCELVVGTDVHASVVSELEPSPGERLIAAVPFSAAAVRGFDVVDDGTPLRCFRVSTSAPVDLTELRRWAPTSTTVDMHDFDLDDETYAATVARLQMNEIAQGAGCNFVLSRTALGTVSDVSVPHLVDLFCRLAERERGTYWTFLMVCSGAVLLGASPERHLSVENRRASMTPISGTLSLGGDDASPDALRDFLDDEKESDELAMVLDEELKMMTSFCSGPVTVNGPNVRSMSRVIHTEYELVGTTDRPITEALTNTLFAPTVTGGPVRSACEVISRYEPGGRGYYAGVIADLVGPVADEPARLDSAILIRTARIDPATSRLELRVGSTIVRHSDPQSEADETRAKARGMVAAITDATPTHRSVPLPSHADEHSLVAARLKRRNEGLSTWWLGAASPPSVLAGRSVLVLDAEDDFTQMIACIVRAAAGRCDVVSVDRPFDPCGYDVVVLGPGPGDPTDAGDLRIAAMRAIVDRCLDESIPLVAVCLGHQVLCERLGLPVERRQRPNQGRQIVVEHRGRTEVCGFYNSFAARSPSSMMLTPRACGIVEVERLRDSTEVSAVRARGLAGVQFHPESVLTRNGAEMLVHLVDTALRQDDHPALTEVAT